MQNAQKVKKEVMHTQSLCAHLRDQIMTDEIWKRWADNAEAQRFLNAADTALQNELKRHPFNQDFLTSQSPNDLKKKYEDHEQLRNALVAFQTDIQPLGQRLHKEITRMQRIHAVHSSDEI